VVFALGAEQGVFTTHALIKTFFSMITILSAERSLGTGLARHPVLFSIQLSLPFLFTSCDFFHHACHCNVFFEKQF
jgi:hypothetical protein